MALWYLSKPILVGQWLRPSAPHLRLLDVVVTKGLVGGAAGAHLAAALGAAWLPWALLWALWCGGELAAGELLVAPAAASVATSGGGGGGASHSSSSGGGGASAARRAKFAALRLAAAAWLAIVQPLVIAVAPFSPGALGFQSAALAALPALRRLPGLKDLLLPPVLRG